GVQVDRPLWTRACFWLAFVVVQRRCRPEHSPALLVAAMECPKCVLPSCPWSPSSWSPRSCRLTRLWRGGVESRTRSQAGLLLLPSRLSRTRPSEVQRNVTARFGPCTDNAPTAAQRRILE